MAIVVILVIMDEVYTLGEGKDFQSDIVILVIMEEGHSFIRKYENRRAQVVILVIMDMVYTFVLDF